MVSVVGQLRKCLVACAVLFPARIAAGAVLGAACDIWDAVAVDKSKAGLFEALGECYDAVKKDRELNARMGAADTSKRVH